MHQLTPAFAVSTTRRAALRSVGAALCALALLVILPACSRDNADAPPAGDSRVHVVATTGMVADLARQMGGEFVRVTTLMGAGTDPHLYKPTPSDIRALRDADVILASGLKLEGKLAPVLAELASTKPVVLVGETLPEAQLLSDPSGEKQHDPHVWFDVALWAQTVPAVRDALSRAAPQHESAFAAAASAYEGALLQLHEETRAAIGAIPRERRVLVTAHDAFAYFGRAYDIEVRAVQGISTESEASLNDINALVDLLVERKIPAVFIESSVPRRTIEALLEGARSRGHSVTIGGELFSDAMGPEDTPEATYPGMIRHNARIIVEALR